MRQRLSITTSLLTERFLGFHVCIKNGKVKQSGRFKQHGSRDQEGYVFGLTSVSTLSDGTISGKILNGLHQKKTESLRERPPDTSGGRSISTELPRKYSLFHAGSLSVEDSVKKRAGDEWGLVGKKERSRPLLFSPGSRSPLIPLFARSLF